MRQHRITRSAALGLALTALATPTAGAQQDLRNPDSREAVATVSQDLRNADNRSVAAPSAANPWQDLRAPDTFDAANGRGTFSAPEVTVVKLPEPSAPVAAPSGGIDWADAGIGAGSMIAIVLLALGGTVAVAHRKDNSQAAPTV